MRVQITNTNNFFVGERIINKYLNIKKDSSGSNWFDDFLDIFDIWILYINITWIFLSRTRRKLRIRFSGGGGYFLSTSIPMTHLSNRCNWCSITKRRESSSESGVLWSDKESNLFKCSCYSIFPWKRRSAYRNCSWYFKEGWGFYGTSP